VAEGPGVNDDVVEDGRDGPVLRIRVRTRSSRRGVLGVANGALSVGVGAPPEGGKANDEALGTVARWLGVAPAKLRIVSGGASRSKRLLVTGETAGAVRLRVARGLAGRPGKRGERRPGNGP
jgi:uncharacterized protein (TIGR00251 family)